MKLMSSGARRFVLFVHVGSSVGLLGAVGAFLLLAIVGATNLQPEIVKAIYLTQPFLAWYLVLPLAVAALLIGIISSLGTNWGLFRHYWIIFKLVMTVIALGVFVVQLPIIDALATMAAKSEVSGQDFASGQSRLIIHAAGGLLVLILPVLLSVYKPQGRTAYGWHKSQIQPQGAAQSAPDLESRDVT